MDRCQKCGKEVGIGAWPFCPHGKVDEYHPFKPYWDQDLLYKPVYIESLAQRNRIMRENHIDHRGRQVGMPHCEV